MSFFIRNKNQGRDQRPSKRKATEAKLGKGRGFPLAENQKKKKPLPGARADEEIQSDDEIDSEEEVKRAELYESSEDEEDKETAQEKRLRLAKEYLSQLETQEKDNEDDEVNDAITDRLKQEALDRLGRLHKDVADKIEQPGTDDISYLRGHQLPVTCVVITPDDLHVFSAGKDCSIIKWDVKTKKKLKVIHGGRKGTEDKHIGHTTHIHCIAISSDGKYLVSGDQDKNIMVWNPETCERLHVFSGHRGPVTGLAFRKGTHQLFSTSKDKTVKIWNLTEMAYVETLFGHQDALTGVDSLSRDRALTSGGRDRSLRIWKVVEESQLVFHGHNGSIDCVALIDEEHFISGADDNSLALWSVMKKKPMSTINHAHGTKAPILPSPAPPTPPASPSPNPLNSSPRDNWITAVAALQYSDLVASGSRDGCLKLWKCNQGYRSLTPLFSLPIAGFLNSIKFSSTGDYMVVGVGQEHRLGRWWRIKDAKNGLAIVQLKRKPKT